MSVKSDVYDTYISRSELATDMICGINELICKHHQHGEQSFGIHMDDLLIYIHGQNRKHELTSVEKNLLFDALMSHYTNKGYSVDVIRTPFIDLISPIITISWKPSVIDRLFKGAKTKIDHETMVVMKS